jgi:hypothetical protein
MLEFFARARLQRDANRKMWRNNESARLGEKSL